MKLAPGAQNSMPKDADALTIASNDFAQSTVPGHARDAGLVRTVGTFGLAASVINSVIGAGIFIVPAAMAAATGVYACLAFLGCAVAMGTVVLCFAEGGRRVPTSGGPYGYIEAAFGPIAGSIAGTLVWVSAVLACGGVLAALADSLASVVSPTFAAAARAGVIVSALGFLVAINLRGVSSGTRFIAAATLVKLVPLLIFIAVGAGAMHATHFHAASTTVSPEGFGRAAILAMFTLVGMETALGASGEVARPTRTIPRALITAMAFVALLYVSIQLIAQGILGAALATSSAPLADAMSRINPTLRALLLAGASVSMVAWIGSDILGSPRVLFALARDGLLPSVLGRVHARTRVPYLERPHREFFDHEHSLASDCGRGGDREHVRRHHPRHVGRDRRTRCNDSGGSARISFAARAAKQSTRLGARTFAHHSKSMSLPPLRQCLHGREQRAAIIRQRIRSHGDAALPVS